MKKILASAVVVVICTLGARSFAAEKATGAQDTKAEKSEPAAKGKTKAKADDEAEPAADKHQDEHAHSADDSFMSVPKGCPICPVRSTDELNVLMTLRERHADVMAREAVVTQREANAAGLEKNLDERVAKLDDKMARLEERLNMAEPGRAAKEKRITTLVETLTGLTAKKAAPILAETEPEIAAELLRRMDAAKAAALLAIMPPTKAGQFISLGIGTPKEKAAAPKSAAAPENTEASP